MKIPALEYGSFYHIYNRGINGCDLFRNTENYEYFLHLYDKHISSIANAYAWVLMPNHFHCLVKIKDANELRQQGVQNLDGVKGTKRNLANQKFSNLFNAYTKAINKRYHRTGSLFEHPFRRIVVNNTHHLQYLVYYIHHNPIHHGFCEHFLDYPWSSYLSILSPKNTKLSRGEVLKWYNSPDSFKNYHANKQLTKYEQMHIDFLGDGQIV